MQTLCLFRSERAVDIFDTLSRTKPDIATGRPRPQALTMQDAISIFMGQAAAATISEQAGARLRSLH